MLLHGLQTRLSQRLARLGQTKKSSLLMTDLATKRCALRGGLLQATFVLLRKRTRVRPQPGTEQPSYARAIIFSGSMLTIL